jgi:hypothetical protein
MNPALLQVIVFAAERLLTEAPAAYAKLAEIFSRKDVTVEDLQKLRADIAAQKYGDFVPKSKIPPS